MKRQKDLRWIAVAVTCLMTVVALIAVFAPRERENAAFVPPAFDENAVQGRPEVPDDLGWGELDAMVYKVFVCGVVRVEDGGANVWLTNPESNTVWLKLRILDQQGNILGETGIIRPGEYVQRIAFDQIPEPGTAIALKLMAYEPETYYSAGAVTLNTTAS